MPPMPKKLVPPLPFRPHAQGATVQAKGAAGLPPLPPAFRPGAGTSLQPKLAPAAGAGIIQRATWAARLAASRTPAQVAAADAAQQQANQQFAAQQLAQQQAAAAAQVAAAAALLLAQRQAGAPMGNINLAGSAGNHYADGWGARYGITSAPTLRARVGAEWVDGEGHDGGNLSFDLGTHTVGHQTSGCNVLYRKNWNNGATRWDAYVWHCGPTTLAG